MSSPHPKIQFDKYEYPPDHWSVSNATFKEYGIYVMQAFGHQYAVFFYPKSCYAYRLIVQLLAPTNKLLIKTYNRRWTSSEMDGFYLVCGRAANMLMDDGLIGQTFVLGNGSHAFDAKTRTTICGKKNEPCMLHGHILFRGDPDYEYMKGVKLIGPIPGVAIPMAASLDNASEELLKQQNQWKVKDREIALKWFKERTNRFDNKWKFKLIDNTKPFDAEDYSLKQNEEQKENGDDKFNVNKDLTPEQQKLKIWLENKVKLPQYYDVFIGNGIEELSVVASMDKDTLKDMGIDTIEHQTKILDEVKKLKG